MEVMNEMCADKMTMDVTEDKNNLKITTVSTYIKQLYYVYEYVSVCETLTYSIILKKYFNLEIGTREAKKLLGMSPRNNSTWSKITNQYKDKYNIDKDFRNNIDLLKAQEKRIKSLKK